jgi:Domain of unknown function (DUF4192)
MSTATAVDFRDDNFEHSVQSFRVDIDSQTLNAMQQDGATAIVDLAGEYESMGCSVNTLLKARVLGRLSDIQVRDFALGSHNEKSMETYFAMWSELLSIAPTGFIAPVASLCAAIAYESADKEGAAQYLRRAIADDARYSLATLLQRVFESGWPINAFAAMRADLHPKVCALIFI